MGEREGGGEGGRGSRGEGGNASLQWWQDAVTQDLSTSKQALNAMASPGLMEAMSLNKEPHRGPLLAGGKEAAAFEVS